MSEEKTSAVIPAEAIAFAAAWWAERLGTVPDSKYDPQPSRYSPEERERFRVALETAIGNHLRGEVPELHGHPQRAVRYSNHENVVYFDYDPDDTLCAAAEIAGITLGWRCMRGKTTMILEESEIRVSDGYAAPWEVIWHPPCQGQAGQAGGGPGLPSLAGSGGMSEEQAPAPAGQRGILPTLAAWRQFTDGHGEDMSDLTPYALFYIGWHAALAKREASLRAAGVPEGTIRMMRP